MIHIVWKITVVQAKYQRPMVWSTKLNQQMFSVLSHHYSTTTKVIFRGGKDNPCDALMPCNNLKRIYSSPGCNFLCPLQLQIMLENLWAYIILVELENSLRLCFCKSTNSNLGGYDARMCYMSCPQRAIE